jgi:hypothetical protein
MIARYVEAKKTPLTFDNAAQAMKAALADLIKSKPKLEVLALALAKSALETGRWQSMWCQNWGNIKASDTYSGMYCCITLNEVIGGKVIWFAPSGQLIGGPNSPLVGAPCATPPGHPQTRMRAYANHFDGAFDYVEFVGTRKRYLKAWQALLTGNATAYVHELKVSGYFTAPEEPYRKGVVSLQKEFLLKLEGKNPERTPDDLTDWASLRAIVASQLADSAREARDSDHLDKMAEIGGIESEPAPKPVA